MFQTALRGIYQQKTYLQDYFYEYFVRKNLNNKTQLFHAVLTNMVLSKPIKIIRLELIRKPSLYFLSFKTRIHIFDYYLKLALPK